MSAPQLQILVACCITATHLFGIYVVAIVMMPHVL